MGIEHRWGQNLCDINLGKRIEFNPYEDRRLGNTPNQKAQFAALFLATALEAGNSSQIREAITICNQFFEKQERAGHMCLKRADAMPDGRNPPNEMLIAGAHYGIWALAKATILRYKLKYLAECRAFEERPEIWWDREFSLYALFSTTDGMVVCPSTRWVATNGKSPCYQRDAIHRERVGLPHIGKATKEDWWDLSDPQQAGVAWMRQLIRRGWYAMPKEFNSPLDWPFLPRFADEIRVHREPTFHYAYAPNGIRAMKVVNQAYANYETGEIHYDPIEITWDRDEDVVIRAA